MPGRDGTGPRGDGRPGRNLGPCDRVTRCLNRGRGFGGGRQFRFRGTGMPANVVDAPGGVYDYDTETLKARKA